MIRSAESKDLMEIHALIQENLESVNSKDYPDAVIAFMKAYYSEANLQKWFEERPLFLVYLEADEVMGTVMLDGHEVKGLYVKQTCHSKGVGRQLMAALEASAHVEELILYASLTAHEFYESVGYKTIKKVNDQEMGMAYLMSKILYIER